MKAYTWFGTALVAALVGLAGVARADPVSFKIHPLGGDAASGSSAADAQALLVSSIAPAIRRSERLRPGKPLFLKATCGRVPAPSCLAPLADGGVVVAGTVREAGSVIAVSLQAVDAGGHVYGPVQLTVDTFLQSSQPFVDALLELERRIPAALGNAAVAAGAPARPVPGAAAAAPARPPPGATSPPAPDATAPASRADLAAAPPSARAQPALAYREPRPVTGAWRRPAGQWTTAAGVALLAGGATFAVLNRQLASDLDDRFKQNRLTTSDASRYDRVETYNLLSTALLVAGGVATVGGAVLWSTAPEVGAVRGGATVGVRGSF